MSQANHFFERKGAFEQYTKTLTNAATYSTRHGGPSDNFIEDRIISVITTADGNDLVITVNDGTYLGQRLLVVLTTLGDNETVTVTTTTGDDGALSVAGDYDSFEWVGAKGWKMMHNIEAGS